jgi:RNA polymerase sigma-70 factor, ECF subfamily
MNDPDRELVRDLKARKEEAFLEFADRFSPAAFWIANRTGIPEEESSEVVPSWIHDVLLKVDAYQEMDDARFANWVFRLFRNAAADWWRTKDPVELEEISDKLPDPRSTEQEPEEVLETVEKISAVREAIESLEERARRIVELHLDGNTFAEVAAVLSVNETNARVIYHRALKRLKAILEKDPRLLSSRRSA